MVTSSQPSFIFFNVSRGSGSASTKALRSLAPAASVSYHVVYLKIQVYYTLRNVSAPLHSHLIYPYNLILEFFFEEGNIIFFFSGSIISALCQCTTLYGLYGL